LKKLQKHNLFATRNRHNCSACSVTAKHNHQSKLELVLS
jgi:hypothetical protein